MIQAETDSDVFSQTVEPLVRQAKKSGATAEALTKAFIGALSTFFTPQEAKETVAMLGFRSLLGNEGGSVDAEAAATLYGGPTKCGPEAVRKAARLGQVVAVRDGLGNLHFPVWQFSARGGTLPGLREILSILQAHPHANDLRPFTFFLNPSAALSGRTPLEALRQGNGQDLEIIKRSAAAASE